MQRKEKHWLHRTYGCFSLANDYAKNAITLSRWFSIVFGIAIAFNCASQKKLFLRVQFGCPDRITGWRSSAVHGFYIIGWFNGATKISQRDNGARGPLHGTSREKKIASIGRHFFRPALAHESDWCIIWRALPCTSKYIHKARHHHHR